MCPDRQLISLYKDGELPSPWKEKLEAHMATCPDCANTLQSYYRVSSFLASQQFETEHLELAKRAIWKNLTHTIPSTEKPAQKHQWKHPLVVPLPAAIAALVLVAILASFATPLILRQGNANTQGIAKINTEVPGIIPVSDMQGLLQYLENQAVSADIVIIKLPDTSNFIPSGQPEIIRSVDYQGRR